MFALRKPPPPLPQYRHVPLAPSFWDRPLEDFGGHVMEGLEIAGERVEDQ